MQLNAPPLVQKIALPHRFTADFSLCFDAQSFDGALTHHPQREEDHAQPLWNSRSAHLLMPMLILGSSMRKSANAQTQNRTVSRLAAAALQFPRTARRRSRRDDNLGQVRTLSAVWTGSSRCSRQTSKTILLICFQQSGSHQPETE